MALLRFPMNVISISRKQWIVFFYDLCMIPIAWILAYLFRFDFYISDFHQVMIVSILPGIIILQAISYWFFGVYRGIWRFASMPDLFCILRRLAPAPQLPALEFLEYTARQIPQICLSYFRPCNKLLHLFNALQAWLYLNAGSNINRIGLQLLHQAFHIFRG